MKKFWITIPFFIHLTLDFCLQNTFSFSNTSSNSPFLNILLAARWDEKLLSCSFSSKTITSEKIIFFFSFKFPKYTLFHSFNFDLTNYSFFMNLWPSHHSTRHSFHQPPKISWKSEWISHMFSNLKGVSPYLRGFISNKIGQWSNINMRKASWIHCGKSCSQSLENKNLSNLFQIVFSSKLDQMNDAFLKGRSISSHSLIRSSKSSCLRLTWILLTFLKFFLWH